jgi:DNA-binding transcriptional MerR regulator
LTKLRTTGMPIRRMREFASLCRQGVASAGQRREILIEQRAAVVERISELQSCLDTLHHKIDNYECLVRNTAGTAGEREGVSA